MSKLTNHGTKLENLIDQILRNRIYDAKYYKEQCFGLNAETLIDRALELDGIGGTFGGNRKPSNFLCLILKMLEIQVEEEVIIEFIKNREHKYITCLGCFYFRLTGRPVDIFKTLEPLYSDYRKIRRKLLNGKYDLIHLDEFIEELLTQEVCCDVALPFLPQRHILEQNGQIQERESALDEDDLKALIKEEKEQRKESFKLKFKKVEDDSSTTDEEEERKAKWNPEKKENKNFVWKSEDRSEESMSIEETNEIRRKLGLKPLE